jgi:predicted alpha/beta hydrolase
MSRALDEHVVDFEAGDGAPLRLTRLRGAATHRGPVMLVHGAGVRSRLFRPPVKTSIVDLLTEHGYEVWLLDWRASIDLPPRPWSLDDAALHDHPVAVKRVVKETGAKEIKALVHCQGSTSFTMAAIAGLVPEVTTVVTNAVSLHPIVSAGGRLKLGLLLPMVAAVTPSLDPRWGAEAHGFVPRACAAYANLTHRHCDNRVCKMVSFVYGYGDPALWSHEMIS